MGGQSAGALASRVVIETLPGFLKQTLTGSDDVEAAEIGEAILSGVVAMSTAVASESETRPELRGMGATVVMAVIRNGQATFGHMGDSRAYLLREEQFLRMTKDHTLAVAIAAAGTADVGDSAAELAKSRLVQYVGMRETPRPDVSQPIPLQPGDRILLCSDGLTNMLDDDRIAHTLKTGRNPTVCSQSLIDEANAAGGEDNVTALVVEVGGGSERRK